MKDKKKQKNNTPVKTKSENKKNTVANSIPYENVYTNGIIEVKKNKFSKSYRLTSVNFKTQINEKQDSIADAYAEFLGSFDKDVDVQITLYNRTVNEDQFLNSILIPERGDGLDDLREEYNQIIMDKTKAANNNLVTEIYLTITIDSSDIFKAIERFKQIDVTVSDSMDTVAKVEPKEMTLIERLDLLNQIYNGNEAMPLNSKRVIGDKEIKAFSLENCAKQGITTKDVIAPSGFSFSSVQAMVGSRYAKSYYIKSYPTWIKATLMTDFTSLPTNLLVSVYFNAIEQSEAVNFVKRQRTNINSENVERQKKATSHGYILEDESSEISIARSEADILMNQLTQDNGRLFTCTFIITVFADSEQELKAHDESLKMIANKNLIMLAPLDFQQEAALNSALPLGNKQVYGETLITDQTAGAVIPFSVKEVRDEGGLYYGLHAINHSMIVYNRLNELNSNGCILGMPGAGKSFAAKQEMINVLLRTNDEIYIIDPEEEYVPIANAMNGTVVKMSNGSSVHINPLDMDLRNVNDEGDPIAVKSQFIEGLCEIMIDSRFGLSSIEKTIIDRCVTELYDPYIKYLKSTGKYYDAEHAPTLVDFYEALLNQPYAEAQNLALGIERFAIGSLNYFAHKTNVNVHDRFRVFDIRNVGEGLKELALQISLDHVWNRMITNKEEGKTTWFYIDEFHLMMRKPSSASYISNIWKRARKWAGVPCAITQNVEDMLKSEDARTVINNSDFIMLLRQSAINKKQLASLLDISPTEQKYMSTAKAGVGLLHIGDDCVPMSNSFPHDTKLYEIMNTKPEQ